MPEPATDQAGGSVNGAGSPEFVQLRELLVGPERAQIAGLEERVGNPAKRSADLAEVLPEAIKSARGKPLREALEPIFEKAFASSITKHKDSLASVIYPVIGPSITKAIAAAIREFAENLNQIAEKSASLRGIQWRIEALITGKSFSEILLVRSLLYRVERVFLIHTRSGLLLQDAAAEGVVLKDADMIAGMFTALQDFVSDSFTGDGQVLQNLDTANYRLWIQYGPKAFIVGAVSGTAPTELKGILRRAIDQIHESQFERLEKFKQDDLSVFESTRPLLESCLLGQSAPGKKKKPVFAWMLVTALVLLAGSWMWYRAREQGRWDRYFDALRNEPGVVVTGIEKRGKSYVVEGMMDPKADDPVKLLQPAGLDAGLVAFHWRPFLSLEPKFVTQRDYDAAKNQIEKELIRFETGSAKLPLAEAGRIEEVAELLHAHPAMRVTVAGRADEVGTQAANMKISTDRTAQVIQALVAQGIAADRMQPASLGDSRPLRTGGTEWDRAANRSVSFHVH
jgi:OOP family OmpA-OmpF porin